MSKYMDNVKINNLDLSKKISIESLDKTYNYIKNKTNLNNEIIIYIMSILLKDVEDENYDIDTLITKLYNKNKNIMSKHYPNINYANNTNEIYALLKKRNPYILFEDVNDNINYYEVLWEHIHN